MNVAITLRVMSLLGSRIAKLIGGISQHFAIRFFEQGADRCCATCGCGGLITAERDGYFGGTSYDVP